MPPPATNRTRSRNASQRTPEQKVEILKGKLANMKSIVRAPNYLHFRHQIDQFSDIMQSSSLALGSEWAGPFGDIITQLHNVSYQPTNRHELYRPLLTEFGQALLEAASAGTERAQLAAVQGAINALKTALAPNTKLVKAAYKRELRRKHHLRFRLAQLAPLGKLPPLSKPLEQMNLTELENLATEKADDLASFRALNLDAMREDMCRTCQQAFKKRQRKWRGKFPDKERGGTAIPFIPGLFVRGKVSMKEVLL
ncbi:hypothetical protein FRC09_001806 [Ceratobasidium sp. 395]|nr:hypothetical protein FRC09_001806 [Ceratobasidium sp. 395]